MNRPKTIICDIDGTLIYHHGDLSSQINEKPKLLPGVIEKINECGGPRVLINDLKPTGTHKTAIAYNLERNIGVKEVDV